MGCFNFRTKKSLRKKGKKRPPQEQEDEDGNLVTTRSAAHVVQQTELTAVNEPQQVDTPPLDSSGVPTTASPGEPTPDSPGEPTPASPVATSDDVVLRRDLPDGTHVSRAPISSNSIQARPLTKEFLLSEIESLRAELDMRREELQSLKQGYNELCDTADKLERARRKCGDLTTRVEDLQAQLEIRREAERKLTQYLEETRAALAKESREKELLSQRLDEAEYKLRSMDEAPPSSNTVRVHT